MRELVSSLVIGQLYHRVEVVVNDVVAEAKED